MTSLPWSGVVLAGGSSRRFGRTKALAPIGAVPLIRRSLDALSEAGPDELYIVGGDAPGLADLGCAVEADRWPGEGPLGGIVTALGLARCERVVVWSCDLVSPSPALASGLLVHLEEAEAEVAVPRLDGRPQVLCSAWRRAARSVLEQAFVEGTRAPVQVLARLEVVEVEGFEPEWMRDADRPEDLERYASS